MWAASCFLAFRLVDVKVRNPPTPPLPWHQRCQNHCGAKWLVPSKRILALPSCFVQFIQSLYRLYHLQKFLRLTIIIDLNSLYLQHLQARYSYRCGNVLYYIYDTHTHIYIYICVCLVICDSITISMSI